MKTTFVYIVVIVSLVFYLFFGHNGVVKYRELLKVKKDYEKQVLAMEEKIKDLNRELELVKKDKEYLEYLIRKELSLRKPNEDLYIIEKDGKLHSQPDNSQN